MPHANANCNVDCYGDLDSLAYTNGNTYSYSNTRYSYATAPTATTPTPTPTPTATCGQYTISQIGGSIVPGTTDTGNHCDDCTTPDYAAVPLHAVRSDLHDSECGLQRHTAIC